MGHLFRSCVLAEALRASGRTVKLYLSDHAPGIDEVKRRGLAFGVVPDQVRDIAWEPQRILSDKIEIWINDMHGTDRRSTQRIKATGVPVVTLDDRGSGAADSDLHIAALFFDPREQPAGRRVLLGTDYLILNPEIAKHRRQRSTDARWIVTLGGADTYGVTPKVMRLLSRHGRSATVIVGPAFTHDAELAAAASGNFVIKRNVASLIEELGAHDIAITGGGVTPFEAHASGLPCIVIANEDFEVPVGRSLAERGGAIYAGHHGAIDETALSSSIPVADMSAAALRAITLDGTRRVVEAIAAL
jgi:spore coat polysaccharide biosynthesis predicted glycosyltransferase SpsG